MTVRLGILGFAHGHIHLYCNEWRSRPDLGIEVAHGWDPDSSRLRQAAEQHALTPWDSADDLLLQSDLDAVIITAETSLHAGLVEQAARAGKAIVLQKPLALTLEEADRIVHAVDTHQTPFTLAWQMRVDPQNLEMKRWVDSGALGRLLNVRRRHGLATHRWPGFEDLWHVKPELNGNIWMDDAAHAIDFIYWLLGMPQSVTAEIVSLLNPRVPFDNGVAVFRYADGPLAEVACSFTCAAGENTTEIIGEKGVLIQNYGDAPSCDAPRPEGAIGLKWFLSEAGQWVTSASASPARHGVRIAALAEPLADFLHGRRSAIATAEEGRDVLRLTLATCQSSRSGCRISDI